MGLALEDPEELELDGGEQRGAGEDAQGLALGVPARELRGEREEELVEEPGREELGAQVGAALAEEGADFEAPAELPEGGGEVEGPAAGGSDVLDLRRAGREARLGGGQDDDAGGGLGGRGRG
ncbi:MAG TPA: hypothetical protein VGX16_01025 [Solirubrobacteraceae bacterium]|nr:hypothetical protein [Solirubrobacteraceae bacterium]